MYLARAGRQQQQLEKDSGSILITKSRHPFGNLIDLIDLFRFPAGRCGALQPLQRPFKIACATILLTLVSKEQIEVPLAEWPMPSGRSVAGRASTLAGQPLAGEGPAPARLRRHWH